MSRCEFSLSCADKGMVFPLRLPEPVFECVIDDVCDGAVVLFLAKTEPYQGKVVSAVVRDQNEMNLWGLN